MPVNNLQKQDIHHYWFKVHINTLSFLVCHAFNDLANYFFFQNREAIILKLPNDVTSQGSFFFRCILFLLSLPLAALYYSKTWILFTPL